MRNGRPSQYVSNSKLFCPHACHPESLRSEQNITYSDSKEDETMIWSTITNQRKSTKGLPKKFQ